MLRRELPPLGPRQWRESSQTPHPLLKLNFVGSRLQEFRRDCGAFYEQGQAMETLYVDFASAMRNTKMAVTES
jgi:hypothetical protein